MISYFKHSSINEIPLPERFTFPFYYEPHPLAGIAAAELQLYIETFTGLDHNFGLGDDKEGLIIGKMFGVLVVQDTEKRLGYLSAFSGKLADSNHHPKFVPPVFDMLETDSFFLKEQELINRINDNIDEIDADESYLQLKLDHERFSNQSQVEISDLKNQLKENKDKRGKLREELRLKLSSQQYEQADNDLIQQSLYDKRLLKALTKKWNDILNDIRIKLSGFEEAIESLKNERKERSAVLQQQLFDQYVFLNKAGKYKSLQEIFSETPLGRPPAAAGECAMPKLLQYAFKNNYKPIAMAEFWWGASPKSEIRKHKQYYPSCTGKCKPILAHMLEGIPVDENPLLQASNEIGVLKIIYEDDSLLVVNKPAGLRSVPGVTIHDSVYSRVKEMIGSVEPLMIHRLDMDTSGLLVIARNSHIHKHIQRQFLQRKVSKRYTALLSKVITADEGEVDLPLAPDLLNRPRQIVCFESGKKSVTRWKVAERYESITRIDFWPLTGRTHQLRMHAAHELGLNAAIVGDDLYGTAAERMYLHAAYLEFIHPKTKELMKFEVESEF